MVILAAKQNKTVPSRQSSSSDDSDDDTPVKKGGKDKVFYWISDLMNATFF